MKRTILSLLTIGVLSMVTVSYGKQTSNFTNSKNVDEQELISNYKNGSVVCLRNDSFFVAEVSEDGTIKNLTYTSDFKNVQPEGQMTLGKKSGKLYYTKSGKLFTAKQTKRGKWVEDENIVLKGTTVQRDKYKGSVLAYANWRYLPNDSIVVLNPTLNEEETEMYFASNMQGSKGLDIWKVEKDESGEWGTPTKLDLTVNSSSDENYPYLREDGTLTFASNRKLNNKIPDKGKYNVYVANLTDKSAPQSLASLQEQEAKQIAEAKKQIEQQNQLAMNNSSELVNDSQQSSEQQIVSGNQTMNGTETVDKNGNPLISPNSSNQNITMNGSDSNSNSLASNSTNQFTEEDNPSSKATNKDSSVSTHSGENVANNGSAMTKQSSNDDNGQLINGENRSVVNEKIGALLSQREKDNSSYKVRDLQEIEEAMKQNADTVLLASKNVVATHEMRIFYFEFNRDVPNGTYKEDMDVLLDFINSYPDSKFLLVGNTDERGSETYNDELSLRRAQWVQFNLLLRGVKLDRLQIRGDGERHPIVKNAQTEEDHQKNRRVEVIKLK